jgi:hypothetical protein
MTDISQQSIPPFIRRAMPEASESELLLAVQTFKEYMAIVWNIYQQRKALDDSPTLQSCDRVNHIIEV